MARWGAARDACQAPATWPAQWLWLCYLLHLQVGPGVYSGRLLGARWAVGLMHVFAAQEAKPLVRRLQKPAMGDLAEATMRVSIPLALSEARRLSTHDLDE